MCLFIRTLFLNKIKKIRSVVSLYENIVPLPEQNLKVKSVVCLLIKTLLPSKIKSVECLFIKNIVPECCPGSGHYVLRAHSEATLLLG